MSDQLYALLVINPQDVKEVVYVTKSGGYYDSSRILWDERTDGPLPDEAKETPEAVVVSGDTLLIDEAKQVEEKAAIEEQKQYEADQNSELERCKQYAQAIDSAKDLESVKYAVKYLLMINGVI